MPEGDETLLCAKGHLSGIDKDTERNSKKQIVMCVVVPLRISLDFDVLRLGIASLFFCGRPWNAMVHLEASLPSGVSPLFNL